MSLATYGIPINAGHIVFVSRNTGRIVRVVAVPRNLERHFGDGQILNTDQLIAISRQAHGNTALYELPVAYETLRTRDPSLCATYTERILNQAGVL